MTWWTDGHDQAAPQGDRPLITDLGALNLLGPCLVARDLALGDLLDLAGVQDPGHREVWAAQAPAIWAGLQAVEPFKLVVGVIRPPPDEALALELWLKLETEELPGGLDAAARALTVGVERQGPVQPAAGLRAVRRAEEAGWIWPVEAIRLTERGHALVSAVPAAVDAARKEQQARDPEAIKALVELTPEEVKYLDSLQVESPLLLLAQATKDQPVPRGTTEPEGITGPPSRTTWSPKGRKPGKPSAFDRKFQAWQQKVKDLPNGKQ